MKKYNLLLLIFCVLTLESCEAFFRWGYAKPKDPPSSSQLPLQENKVIDRSDRAPSQISTNSNATARFLSIANFFPFLLRPQKNLVCGDLGAECRSSHECRIKGGKSSGKCANGFGVCCILEAKCGDTVKNNNTYLVNTGYPAAMTDIGNCQFLIEKMHKNICQLRLEMDILSLSGPNTQSQCNQDTFSINGGTGEPPIVICGLNSGQHLIVELARGSVAARINIATTSKGIERSWRIRVQQIACNSVTRAPPHCLQYFTDYAGTINSFNYQNVDAVNQLADQSYTSCIMSRPGFCGITFKSSDFSLTRDGTSTASKRTLQGDNDCNTDFVSIFVTAKDGTVETDRYCGNNFTDVTTYSKPFQLRVFTDSNENSGGEVNNRGFSMNYLQIPC